MTSLTQEAGVRYFRFHPLRHLGASTLDRANVSIGSIQRILGHEDRTRTEIHLHSIGEAEREAMQIFDETDEKSHTGVNQQLAVNGKYLKSLEPALGFEPRTC